MKTKRIIFIVLGWLFIAINTLGYLGALAQKKPLFQDKPISYIVGLNFWFMLGALFLWLAGRQKRKMQRTKEKEQLDNFLAET